MSSMGTIIATIELTTPVETLATVTGKADLVSVAKVLFGEENFPP